MDPEQRSPFASSTDPAASGSHAVQEPPAPRDEDDKVVTNGSSRPAGASVRWWVVVIALFLWLLACIAGSLERSIQGLPREGYLTTASGAVIQPCSQINPTAVAADPTVASYFCTYKEVLGPDLPDNTKTVSGDIIWSALEADDVIRAVSQPDVWLTLGVGTIALLFLTEFARATGTMRVGLAASITVIFFGLLLFPTTFTAALPKDMRSELIEAWQWVIAFYFGSEAAVQAFKVWKPGSAAIGGDTAP